MAISEVKLLFFMLYIDLKRACGNKCNAERKLLFYSVQLNSNDKRSYSHLFKNTVDTESIVQFERFTFQCKQKCISLNFHFHFHATLPYHTCINMHDSERKKQPPFFFTTSSSSILFQ